MKVKNKCAEDVEIEALQKQIGELVPTELHHAWQCALSVSELEKALELYHVACKPLHDRIAYLRRMPK
jgi:hypothetical protein